MLDMILTSDVLTPLESLFDSGTLELLPMTKEHPKGAIKIHEKIDPRRPWIDGGRGPAERYCLMWDDIWFRHFGFIPRGCRSCWKVSLKMRSMKDAYKILMEQKDESVRCKIGLETRPWTGNVGGFSAFWYVPLGEGLAGGREIYPRIKKVVRELSEGRLKPILKRGCTEMEIQLRKITGKGSDKWDELAEEGNWDEIEDSLEELFITPSLPQQTEAMKLQVLGKMIRHAADHGDKTYEEFSGGSLIPDLVQYQDSVHNAKNYAGPIFGRWEGYHGEHSAGHKRREGEEGSTLAINFGTTNS